VAVAHDGARQPSLVLDAGTGIRHVTDLCAGEAFRGTVLLSHLHWDHTQGLPFFAAGDRPDARVVVGVPAQGDGVGPVELFARAMSPPHFPIDPTGLRGDWAFEWVDPGWRTFEGFEVLALEVPHKGGRTFGYRVSDGRSTLAYIPDHGPLACGPGDDGLGELHRAALDLCAAADLVIHDAQHTAEELPARAHFGHSAAEYAVRLAETAGARHVLLFHHDPNRTDEAMDAMATRFSARSVLVSTAVEGDVYPV